jgi:hypothetical protein
VKFFPKPLFFLAAATSGAGERQERISSRLPDGESVKIPKPSGIGRFESAAFRPRYWKPAYSTPASTAYMTQVLYKRRDAIASAYLKGIIYVQSAQWDRNRMIVRTPASRKSKIAWVEANAEPTGSIVTAQIVDSEHSNTTAEQVHLRQEPDGLKIVAATHSYLSRSNHE